MAGDFTYGFFFAKEFNDWQKKRYELFKQINTFDKDEELKKTAGIGNLAPYANYSEIKLLADNMNCTFLEVLKLNDIFAMKFLLMNQEYINFESQYFELKAKK